MKESMSFEIKPEGGIVSPENKRSTEQHIPLLRKIEANKALLEELLTDEELKYGTLVSSLILLAKSDVDVSPFIDEIETKREIELKKPHGGISGSTELQSLGKDGSKIKTELDSGYLRGISIGEQVDVVGILKRNKINDFDKKKKIDIEGMSAMLELGDIDTFKILYSEWNYEKYPTLYLEKIIDNLSTSGNTAALIKLWGLGLISKDHEDYNRIFLHYAFGLLKNDLADNDIFNAVLQLYIKNDQSILYVSGRQEFYEFATLYSVKNNLEENLPSIFELIKNRKDIAKTETMIEILRHFPQIDQGHLSGLRLEEITLLKNNLIATENLMNNEVGEGNVDSKIRLLPVLASTSGVNLESYLEEILMQCDNEERISRLCIQSAKAGYTDFALDNTKRILDVNIKTRTLSEIVSTINLQAKDKGEKVMTLKKESWDPENDDIVCKIGTDSEKNKVYIKEIISYEWFLSLDSFLDREILAKRYDELVDYFAKTEALRFSHIKNAEISSDKWIAGHIPKLSEWSFRLGTSGTGEPFTKWLTEAKFYRQIEEMLQFRPDIIAIAPKSAIIPSILLKAMVEEYKDESIDNGFDPFFFIPPNKTYKIKDQTNHGGSYYGIGEEITEAVGSGNLEKQKSYLLEVYKGYKTPGDDADFVKYYFEACEAAKKVILSQIGDRKEINIMVFDEYVYQGKNYIGLQFIFDVAFEMLKIDGKVDPEAQIKKGLISTGNESLSYNSTGKDYISDENYGMKGGSKPEHWLTRELFKLTGEYTMRDYLLLNKKSVKE